MLGAPFKNQTDPQSVLPENRRPRHAENAQPVLGFILIAGRIGFSEAV
jgi:hypothetical protein